MHLLKIFHPLMDLLKTKFFPENLLTYSGKHRA